MINLNPEMPILLALEALVKIAPRSGDRFAQWWFDYADRKYYGSCGTRVRWRLWFEITGQGYGARQYLKAIYGIKWWESKRHARDRHFREMQELFRKNPPPVNRRYSHRHQEET